MIVSAIVAIDNLGVIGSDGEIPWSLPADQAYFKKMTMGHPIIMGRKTYETINRPLPGRDNIIISHDPGYKAEGCTVVTSLDAALDKTGQADEAFIIGGQGIYELAMDRTDRIYLTKIDADIPGDRYFKYQPADWEVSSAEKHAKDEANPYDYVFMVLNRRR